MKALGMIEVRGFLGAVSAADAALKAADVDLNNAEIIRGGLTTVELVGDVAAVEAAVDAGVAVAETLNCLISHHVIARLDPQTERVTTPKKVVTAKTMPTESIAAAPASLVEEKNSTLEKPVAKPTSGKDTSDVDMKPGEEIKTALLKEKVVNLRKQAYKMNLQHFEKSQIKFANKQTLVDAIMAEIERSDHDWN